MPATNRESRDFPVSAFVDTIEPMARLPKGVKPTPHKDRLKKYRDELVESGGRRMSIDLTPEANQALTDVIAHEGVGTTARDVINRALIGEAKRTIARK